MACLYEIKFNFDNSTENIHVGTVKKTVASVQGITDSRIKVKIVQWTTQKISQNFSVISQKSQSIKHKRMLGWLGMSRVVTKPFAV